MGKLFGTDGIRGIANKKLTPQLAFDMARYVGSYFGEKIEEKQRVLIGKDTRISGDMLTAALAAGFNSVGIDVVDLGVVTTPTVAYLTKETNAQLGVMISASHNPMEDNGIKFFSSNGYKLSDDVEIEIEKRYFEKEELPEIIGEEVGISVKDSSMVSKYLEHLLSAVSVDFSGLKIVLDCANGASFELAPKLFKSLEADTVVINDNPDGTNINKNCGSTDITKLSNAVKENKADLGLAFDGDADRLIAVDENGDEVDGDNIMAICAAAMKEKGELKKDTLVATVMSNLGFELALSENKINLKRTKVGDRYVLEAMQKKGYNLGGEQSGHIIFLDYGTTGDGLLSAIKLVETLKLKKAKLSQAKTLMKKLPQVLINTKVGDKTKLDTSQKVSDKISQIEEKLGQEGRVLVRASGTEELIRVMLEGKDQQKIQALAEEIIGVIKQELS
ncbi:phosphoglucosamine mutase [Proteinivorax hydrogeniformans]|uniref:Phosphoglucosamine mutase n=1 Tax=Proteinivorax hydrogeniformans TaxID=1826727 RepID=A0AAU8HU77_9FIRM